MSTKRLTVVALFTAIALIIFVVEAQLAPLAPIPGIKLGLANIVSLFALFWLGKKEAFTILILRIILGSIFSGHGATFLYSLSGGLLSFIIILIFYRTFSIKALYIPSIIGGLFHNIGQLSCAIFILGEPRLLTYLPVLLISGILTGLFTGLCAQYLINHNHFLQKPFTD